MNVDAVGTDFRSIRSRTAGRDSRCRPRSSATAAHDAQPRARGRRDEARRASSIVRPRSPAAAPGCRGPGGAARLPVQLHQGRSLKADARRGREDPRSSTCAQPDAVRRAAHQGRPLDAAAQGEARAARDPEERTCRLLLNLSARAGPGGQQHPVREGLAEPRSARRRTAGLVGEALSRRGTRHARPRRGIRMASH